MQQLQSVSYQELLLVVLLQMNIVEIIENIITETEIVKKDLLDGNMITMGVDTQDIN